MRNVIMNLIKEGKTNLISLFRKVTPEEMNWVYHNLFLVYAWMDDHKKLKRRYAIDFSRERKMSDGACQKLNEIVKIIEKEGVDDILELEEFLNPKLRSFVYQHISEVNYFLEANYVLGTEERVLHEVRKPKTIPEFVIAYKTENIFTLEEIIEKEGNEELKRKLLTNNELAFSCCDAMLWRNRGI